MNTDKAISSKEGNKLIAEFMGAKYCIKNKQRPWNGFRNLPDIPHWVSEDSLEYHTSWDWLIPVVEKIESMENKFQICRRRVEIVRDKFLEGGGVFIVKEETKMQSVYKACVQFIQWHNQQTTTPNL